MADSTVMAPPGTPIWVDLSSSDVEASKAFYGQLFGWEAESLGPEAGGYTMFRKNGKLVAAVGPQMQPQQPVVWSTYISTEDADATARRVQEAGGQVALEPFDVMDAGRMGVFIDPTGAFISVWQPGKHPGAEVFNQPGALCWNELSTRDIQTARSFYTRVFGWTTEISEGPMPYTEWQLNGRSIGGAMTTPPQVPAEVPAHWLVYFAVEDTDAAVARATQLGAQVMVPKTETPAGPFAVLADPQGAPFAVIAVAPARA